MPGPALPLGAALRLIPSSLVIGALIRHSSLVIGKPGLAPPLRAALPVIGSSLSLPLHPAPTARRREVVQQFLETRIAPKRIPDGGKL